MEKNITNANECPDWTTDKCQCGYLKDCKINTEPAPMSSKGIKSADVKVFTHDLSAYQYFRANAGDKFDGEVWYKGTIDHVVTLMEGYAKQQSAKNAQFATEAGGSIRNCLEAFVNSCYTGCSKKELEVLRQNAESALTAPSNNSSSEMVEVHDWTQQDLAFKVADGLDASFNVKYAQTDIPVNAYEIESSLSSIMENFGLQLVIIDRDKFDATLGTPFEV